MKHFLIISWFCCLVSMQTRAQTNIPEPDKSPLDISYFPAHYPVLKIQEKATEKLMARVIYSRPQKNGRVLFGDLISYGKVWRLGANEATELEVYAPVVYLNKQAIKKGRYTLFAIPDSAHWTIIVNRDTDTWGSFRYDIKKDVARMQVPVVKTAGITEHFSLFFEKTKAGFELMIAWDDLRLSVPFTNTP